MTSEPPIKKEGFRRLKAAKHPFTCALCCERYPAGGTVYWKKDVVGPKEYKTTTVCPACIRRV